jgi:predicted PurR-regulated permease PerM
MLMPLRKVRKQFMEIIIEYLKKPIFKRIFVFALLGLAIYLLRGLATLLLLTFIFIYIFSTLQNSIHKFLSRFFPINIHLITALIYILVVSLLVLIVRIYVPMLITQISSLIANLTDYLGTLKGETTSDNLYTRMLIYISNNVDISKYVSSGGTSVLDFLKSVGTVGLYVFLALILSLFFIIEKKSILKFFSRFKQSKLYWMYGDTHFFFRKFANSFGKVIQNQLVISLINTVLSVIVLLILRFPSVLGLGAMIFVLGMIPVAGVFISLIPLSIIAYTTGGLIEIVYVLVLIAVLHALESYVLNPKLMSRTSKMPVFCTFLVLIISEKFFGSWGLLMGIPVTMFVLDVLDVIPDQ